MIGIIGAMRIEVETIKSLMEIEETKTISGVEYVSGKLHGKEIVVAVCGIGKVAAAMCTQTMILTYSPECIINTGVGGSLSNKLNICDIAISLKALFSTIWTPRLSATLLVLFRA